MTDERNDREVDDDRIARIATEAARTVMSECQTGNADPSHGWVPPQMHYEHHMEFDRWRELLPALERMSEVEAKKQERIEKRRTRIERAKLTVIGVIVTAVAGYVGTILYQVGRATFAWMTKGADLPGDLGEIPPKGDDE